MGTRKRVIVHIDGDGFFAACEIAQNEALRGKPVVAGEDKGMALAVSYEAKKRGISRGMTMRQVRELCPDAIITMAHYDTYAIYSRRMYAIARRYSPIVQEYSVDECFVDITDEQETLKMSYEDIAHAIQNDIHRDLGISVSLGFASTKVLAKVASKWRKPAGFTILTEDKIHEFLFEVPIGKVWGIGPSTSALLQRLGVKTALEFALKPESWITEHLAKPYVEIWHELNGRSVSSVHSEPDHTYKSVMKTRTFKPTTDKNYLLSELSNNIERICRKLRRYNLTAKYLSFYLKTQEFTYYRSEAVLPHATSIPHDFLEVVKKLFPNVYKANRTYRATGIVLGGIAPLTSKQPDLFGESIRFEKHNALYKSFDVLRKKFGKEAVFLASSMKARVTYKKKIEKVEETEERIRQEYPNVGIPWWGNAQ